MSKNGKPSEKPFYGWIIMFVMLFIYFGATTPTGYGYGVITTTMVTEYGWQEGVVAAGSSICFGTIAAGCIIGSVIGYRKGFRFVVIVSSLIAIFANLILFLFFDIPQLYLTMVVLTGLCAAMSGAVSSPSLINAWFDRNKGLPMSVVMTGGSIGGFVMPGVTLFLVQNLGVRFGWMFYLCLVIIVCLLGVFVVRDNPEDIGEIRDGRAWVSTHPLTEKDKKSEQLQAAMEKLTIAECYRNSAFIVLALQYFTSRLMLGSFMSLSIFYMVQSGLATGLATLIFTISNVVSLLGRLSSALIYRLHLPKKVVIGLDFVLSAAGGILIGTAHGRLPFLAAGCIILSGASGINISYFPIVISERFGKKHFPIINGTLTTVANIGTAVAPAIIYTVSRFFNGDYGYGFITLSVIVLLSIIPDFVVRDHTPESLAKSQSQ